MSTNSAFTIRLGLIVSLYGIACSGAVGSTSSSPTLAVGMTVEATNTALRLGDGFEQHESDRRRGAGKPGNDHRRSGERRLADILASILQRRPYRVDLPGRRETKSGLAEASSTAPTLSFSAGPTSITAGASSTLSWSSSNGLACTGSGFLPLLGSGSAPVSPSETTTYGINCTNGLADLRPGQRP